MGTGLWPVVRGNLRRGRCRTCLQDGSYSRDPAGGPFACRMAQVGLLLVSNLHTCDRARVEAFRAMGIATDELQTSACEGGDTAVFDLTDVQ